jgi:hypothetical protein
MPGIFLASPKVAGLFFSNFSMASLVNPETLQKSTLAGIFIESDRSDLAISLSCFLM